MQHGGATSCYLGSPAHTQLLGTTEAALGRGYGALGSCENVPGVDLRARRVWTQLCVLEWRGRFREEEGPSGDVPSPCSLLRLILPRQSMEQRSQQGCSGILCRRRPWDSSGCVSVCTRLSRGSDVPLHPEEPGTPPDPHLIPSLFKEINLIS